MEKRKMNKYAFVIFDTITNKTRTEILKTKDKFFFGEIYKKLKKNERIQSFKKID